LVSWKTAPGGKSFPGPSSFTNSLAHQLTATLRAAYPFLISNSPFPVDIRSIGPPSPIVARTCRGLS